MSNLDKNKKFEYKTADERNAVINSGLFNDMHIKCYGDGVNTPLTVEVVG